MFIIPMAGKSSRFFKAGYKKPKYMLPLGETILFDEAIKSFETYFDTDLFLFIIRDEFGVFDFVDNRCKVLGITNYEIVTIEFDTRGQADTVNEGLSRSRFVNNEEIYIFNIDSIRLNFVKPSVSFLEDVLGYLEVFEGEGDHWSFVDPVDFQIVNKTTEKIKISDLCSNGLYYFSTIMQFKDCFKKMELHNDYKELFIAPMYNFFIQDKKIVKYIKVEKKNTLFSGIPEEYQALNKIYNSY
jgi:hypothetical protein